MNFNAKDASQVQRIQVALDKEQKANRTSPGEQ